MQIKPAGANTSHLWGWLLARSQKIASAGKDVGTIEGKPLNTVDGGKLVQPLGMAQKISLELLCDPATPCLGIHP